MLGEHLRRTSGPGKGRSTSIFVFLRLGAAWGFRRRGVQKLENLVEDVIVLNQARLHVSLISRGAQMKGLMVRITGQHST